MTDWLYLAISVGMLALALWLAVPRPSRAADVIESAVAAGIEPPRWVLRAHRGDRVLCALQTLTAWVAFCFALAGVTEGLLRLFGAAG